MWREGAAVDTLLVRRLPAGTKNRLQRQAEHHGRSAEAEARDILLRGLGGGAPSLADVLSSPDTQDIDFEPSRLGIRFREVEW